MSTTSLSGKRVAIYARFSSDKQNASSADDQVARCRAFVTERAGRVDDVACYRDSAISGASLQRPAVERLLGRIRARAYDVLVVEDLDRLSRDLGDSAQLFKQLAYYDCELLSASDGMSSLAPAAKTHLLLKGFMSEAFLDNLRDKTLRGQLARFTAGYATGGVAYGFRSTPKLGAGGEVLAHEIAVDQEQAAVVRRIFREYLTGRSVALIASGLNADRVPAPRSKKRTGTAAWGDSSVRAMLHNDVYMGTWHFARRRWTKVPGTNQRRPKPRGLGDRPTSQERPHLAIIDGATWAEVQARLAAVHRHFTAAGGGVQGKRTRYPLSGLLVCEDCGSLLYVAGGNTESRARYYCTGAMKRGICVHRTAVIEQVARERVLGALALKFDDEWVMAEACQAAQEMSAAQASKAPAELRARRAELAKTETRIRALVEQLSDGAAGEYLRAGLDELAGQARALKAEIAALELVRPAPSAAVAADQVRAWLQDLGAAAVRDPLAMREDLRRLLRGSHIRVSWTPAGPVARAELLPLALLTARPPPSPEGAAISSQHCGGRIWGLEIEAVTIPFEVSLAA